MCCPIYNDQRRTLWDFAYNHDPAFNLLSVNEQFRYLLSNDLVTEQTARTLKNILSVRVHHTSRLIV